MSDDSIAASSSAAPQPSGLFDRLFGWMRGREPSLQESLQEVLDDHDDGASTLSEEERVMLMNLITLRERHVDDVMVPRADIIAVDIDTDFDDLVKTFAEAAHSRLPVYRETLDEVVGMAHIKDVLAAIGTEGSKPSLSEIKHRILFVPPSMPVVDLLLKMRLTRIHMALVVDEYGGTDGLVTIEDLIEQIVGEIEDEHDEAKTTPLIHPRGGQSWDADARALIADLEQLVDLDLLPEERDEYIDTLGGLVVAIAGRVPERGEVIRHPAGLELEVRDGDARRIKRLRIQRVSAPGSCAKE